MILGGFLVVWGLACAAAAFPYGLVPGDVFPLKHGILQFWVADNEMMVLLFQMDSRAPKAMRSCGAMPVYATGSLHSKIWRRGTSPVFFSTGTVIDRFF